MVKLVSHSLCFQNDQKQKSILCVCVCDGCSAAPQVIIAMMDSHLAWRAASCGTVEEDKDVSAALGVRGGRGVRARGDINDTQRLIGHQLTILFLGQQYQSVQLPACSVN